MLFKPYRECKPDDQSKETVSQRQELSRSCITVIFDQAPGKPEGQVLSISSIYNIASYIEGRQEHQQRIGFSGREADEEEYVLVKRQPGGHSEASAQDQPRIMLDLTDETPEWPQQFSVQLANAARLRARRRATRRTYCFICGDERHVMQSCMVVLSK